MNARPRHQRTEAQIEAACDRVIAAAGGRALAIGRGYTDRLSGLPSRRYYLAGHVLWWAPRSSRGRLTYRTFVFLHEEGVYKQLAGAGDDDALLAVIKTLRNTQNFLHEHHAWRLAQDYLLAVGERGFVGKDIR